MVDTYSNLSEQFTLQSNQRNFQRQYAHIYAQRLAILRPILEKRVKQKWSDDIPISQLCDLEKDKRCVIIGTFYKEQSLKPSILKEISEENQLVPITTRERFFDDSDQLVLEDELQRIQLVSKIDVQLYVTGIVVAVLGEEREEDPGKFQVEDILFPGLSPQDSIPLLSEDVWIAFLSGFNIGNDDDASIIEPLKRLAQSSILKDVKHLIVAGNSLGSNSFDKDAVANQARYLSRKTDAASVEGMRHLDSIIKLFTERCQIHLMPGEYDPANYILPQQPLLPVMFPDTLSAIGFNCDQSYKSKFETVTNPYYFKIGSVDILGTSGQNLKDIYKYSSVDDCLEQLESTLRWGHMAPTCPDTLGCYPYYDKDPFIFKSCPRVYFAGNQNSLRWKAVEGDNGQECLLLTIPKFSDTKCCVLLNLKSMEVKQINI